MYHDCEVVKHLMKSVMPEMKVVWIKEQQKKLTLITLTVLQCLVPHLSQDFTENDVVSR